MNTQDKKQNRPNILLVCVDQWRGDCLSINGHHTVHTPYLDMLALNGVRFSSAFSECPTCIAARASLMTGLSPQSTGRVGYQDGVPWDYSNYMAGEFSKNGYHTQSIGKMHTFPERNKLGFDDVILHDGHLPRARRNAEKVEDIDDYIPWLREQTGRPSADYFEHGITCNSYLARPWDKEEYLHPTNFVTSKAVDYLEKRQGNEQPFFLFVSYHRPHPPYDPPAWAFEQYLNKEMPSPPVGDWADFLLQWEDQSPEPIVQRAPADILQRARAGYYGHMTHIDHQLSRLFESLREFRFDENTYVLFISDHGEFIGDHNLFRKTLPYQGSVNVPFILKSPDADEFPSGSVLDAAVGMQDVMPTLLDIAGLPQPDLLDGKSLLPVARQETGSLRDCLHGEHVFFEHSVQYLTDGREKYIWWSGDGREQLFNLKTDPAELHDLVNEKPERVSFWRERLIEKLTGRPEGFTNGKQLLTGRPVSHVITP